MNAFRVCDHLFGESFDVSVQQLVNLVVVEVLVHDAVNVHQVLYN